MRAFALSFPGRRVAGVRTDPKDVYCQLRVCRTRVSLKVWLPCSVLPGRAIFACMQVPSISVCPGGGSLLCLWLLSDAHAQQFYIVRQRAHQAYCSAWAPPPLRAPWAVPACDTRRLGAQLGSPAAACGARCLSCTSYASVPSCRARTCQIRSGPCTCRHQRPPRLHPHTVRQCRAPTTTIGAAIHAAARATRPITRLLA